MFSTPRFFLVCGTGKEELLNSSITVVIVVTVGGGGGGGVGVMNVRERIQNKQTRTVVMDTPSIIIGAKYLLFSL